jgi:drug/metabolite transporter (DMT)-like permease
LLLSKTAGRTDSPLRGIALMMVALIGFTCMDTLAKLLSDHMSPVMVTWARYTSALVFILIIFNPLRRKGVYRSARPLLQILRSCVLFASTLLNFFALHYLQIDQTTALLFATPMLVTVLAGPILGETIGWRRWIAVIVGFSGVLIITNPWSGQVHWAMLLTLTGTLCYAVYNVMTRLLASYDSADTTSIYTVAIGALVSTPLLPSAWTMPDNIWIVVAMCVIGFLGAVAHWFLIKAHEYAPASVLSPFLYVQLLWVTLSGYLVFHQLPAKTTLIGAAVIIASGLYLLTLERKSA